MGDSRAPAGPYCPNGLMRFARASVVVEHVLAAQGLRGPPLRRTPRRCILRTVENDNLTPEDASRVLDRLGEAIADKSIDAVLTLFELDDNVQMFGSEEGEAALGADELRQLWAAVLERPERYSWSFLNERIHGYDGIGWITADAILTIHGASGPNQFSYRLTLILRKSPDEWKIAHYHGSEGAEPRKQP